jgi:large subunit ribosomal protein L22
MEVQAVEKYIRISPKKARLVADVVRGERAVNALAILRFMPKKAAKIIYKALNSAMANATNNAGLNREDLIISKITVDKGPSLKRFRPRSKGMASALLKRTSHITVVVSAEPSKKVKAEKPAVKNDVATEGSK